MKKFSKKGMLLFVGAMAVCAFALPGVSSAASWAGGPHGTLDSPGVGFTSPVAGGLDSGCSGTSSFTTRVDSAQVLTITTAFFRGCTTRTGAGDDCTTTSQGTGFPWRATAVSTNNIQIHGIVVDVRFETLPNAAPCPNLNGASTLLTGTISNGVWDVARREVVFTNAEGLNAHPGNTSWTLRGTFRDTEQTLQVLDDLCGM
jgi:hypothetical protein